MKISFTNYTRFLIIASLLLFANANGYSITGSDAFEKLKERFASVTTMRGNIIISYPEGSVYSGEFQYAPQGRIHINFTDPPGKKIVSNGKSLWVYDSTTDICGVQNLHSADEDDKDLEEEEKKQKELKVFGGFEYLFNGYDAVYISEDAKGITIELRSEHRRYSEILLTLDKDFMLSNARFADKEGVKFVLKLSNLRFGEKFLPGIFNFDIPSDAHLVKNPLDIR